MKNENKIPLLVGVTGHIDLREADRDALLQAVIGELKRLRETYRHTPLKMLNSLAAGADLLCADVAEALGIPLIAALPMETAEYEKDFSPQELEHFRHHLSRAESVFVAPGAEAETGERRDFAYRQAGIYVVEHAHLLLALWDGKENPSARAGTAATVEFALKGNWEPEQGIPVSSAGNTAVIHILTPRRDMPAEGAGETRRIADEEMWDTLMARTEEFNILAAEIPEAEEHMLPESDESDAVLQQLEALYNAADKLSLQFARQFRKALAMLALAGTVLTFAFLLYDEGSMVPMILVCGAALLYAFYCYRQTTKSECHRKYIEYRALAETLRVQMYLRYAGSRLEVQRLMNWSQQQETAWILCTICALNGAPQPEKKRDILNCWVEEQRNYHCQAGKKTAGQLEKNDRVLGIAMKISILTYVVTLIYEFLFGGLGLRPLVSLRDPEQGRTLIKIVLGTLSAGTLFMANYYGKMSLRRVTTDHAKMAKFYEKAADQLTRCGQNEHILEALAREELAENGNWCSYQKDNAPELNF